MLVWSFQANATIDTYQTSIQGLNMSFIIISVYWDPWSCWSVPSSAVSLSLVKSVFNNCRYGHCYWLSWQTYWSVVTISSTLLVCIVYCFRTCTSHDCFCHRLRIWNSMYVNWLYRIRFLGAYSHHCQTWLCRAIIFSYVLYSLTYTNGDSAVAVTLNCTSKVNFIFLLCSWLISSYDPLNASSAQYPHR